MAFYGESCSGLGTVRDGATQDPDTPRACCRPLVRFWWVSGGWLAHVDPAARARLARVARQVTRGWWVPLSTTRWYAATSEGESRTVVLRRSGLVIGLRECGGFPIPVGRRALASTGH